MIIIAWSEFAQYSARCVNALVRSTSEKVIVIATKPTVPFKGMEELSGCKIYWLDAESSLDNNYLHHIVLDESEGNPTPRITFFTSGWALPLFNNLAMQAKTLGARVIAMVDNDFHFSLKELIKALRFRLLFRRRFDGFFVPGKSGRRLMRFYGVPDRLISEGLYAADENLFHDGGPLPSRERKIIYVGRFIDLKNVVFMCKAFKAACDLVDNPWRLELFGCGNLQSELENLASNFPLIKINGFLQPQELAGKYREARAFCLMSKFDHWGFVVHEAALSGCMLILSDRIGAREDFVSDKNGFCVSPFDFNGLVTAFCKVMKMNDDQLLIAHDESIRLSSLVGLAKFVNGILYFAQEER